METIEARADDLEARMQERFKGIAVKIKKAILDELGDIEAEYLPYVFTDTEMNVQIKTKQALDDFLSGREVPQFKLDGYFAKEVRQKIYEDHKDEIIAALKVDFEAEIISLRECLKN